MNFTWLEETWVTGKKVIKENPVIERRTLGRPSAKLWEDCVKKYAEMLDSNSRWRDPTEDRAKWQYVYLEIWSRLAETKVEEEDTYIVLKDKL